MEQFSPIKAIPLRVIVNADIKEGCMNTSNDVVRGDSKCITSHKTNPPRKKSLRLKLPGKQKMEETVLEKSLVNDDSAVVELASIIEDVDFVDKEGEAAIALKTLL